MASETKHTPEPSSRASACVNACAGLSDAALALVNEAPPEHRLARLRDAINVTLGRSAQ